MSKSRNPTRLLESLIYLGDPNQGWACKVVIKFDTFSKGCKLVTMCLIKQKREKEKLCSEKV
jgi:hypothetical protein